MTVLVTPPVFESAVLVSASLLRCLVGTCRLLTCCCLSPSLSLDGTESDFGVPSEWSRSREAPAVGRLQAGANGRQLLLNLQSQLRCKVMNSHETSNDLLPWRN